MRRLLQSAAYRIAFVYAAASTLTMLLVGTVVILVAHSAFARQLDQQIMDDSKGIVAEYREEGFDAVVDAIAVRETGNGTNKLLYAVFAPGGRRLAGRMQAQRPPLGWSDVRFHDTTEGANEARGWSVDLPNGARLLIASDQNVIGRVDRTLIGLFGGAFVAILLFSLLGALLLGRYLKRRLSSISLIADEIIAGDMNRRIATGPRNDEFDRLAQALNRMLDRIASLMTNLRQVSSDIAHDLRTPLTRLRNDLDSGIIDPQRQKNILESALVQVDQVLGLFAAILRITEIEGRSRRRAFTTFNLSDLVQEVYESYQPAVEERGRTIDQAIATGIFLDGDRELIAQAIINLLDNAQIHTPPSTHITILLRQSETAVELTVADDGPGVPVADHEFIMRRFARMERSRLTQGHGLGLNLVQAVVQAHDGVVRLNETLAGFSITICLPV